ncbi:MAG: flagellar basal-body rod protein FlgF [Vulcanimicrobiaceae bacterium]
MDGISWAASALTAARSRLDIAADNLANASSAGFQRHAAHGMLTASGAIVEAAQNWSQGPLRRTGQPLDLALVGRGAFSVRDSSGRVQTMRTGSFERNAAGFVCDRDGRKLLGTAGPIHFPDGAVIRADGAILSGGAVIGRIALAPGTTVRSGFLESSNVNAISEMIDVLAAQRSFESAQKVVTAIDSTHQKASNELARLK